MKNYFFLFLIAGISFMSCSDAEEEIIMETTPSPFAGMWTGTISGDAFGEFEINVLDNGSFTSKTYIDDNTVNGALTLGSGKVNNDGEVMGIIGTGGNATGTTEGLINQNTGRGQGTWEDFGATGTWVVMREE